MEVYCQLQTTKHSHSVKQKVVASDTFVKWRRAAVPCLPPEEITASPHSAGTAMLAV